MHCSSMHAVSSLPEAVWLKAFARVRSCLYLLHVVVIVPSVTAFDCGARFIYPDCVAQFLFWHSKSNQGKR